MIYQVFGADSPVFSDFNRGLVVQGQRTNHILNPRAEGGTLGVVGSGGVMPPNWSATAGYTVEIVAFGTMLGLPSVTIRYTSASTPGTQLIQQINSSMVVASGDNILAGITTRLVAGSLANVTSTVLATSGTTTVALPTVSATRVTSYRVASGVGGVNMSYRYNFAAGVPIDFTVEYAVPTLEFALFASTPTMPPVGTPGASTRGADFITAPLESMGIDQNGVCTVIGVVMLPNGAPTGADQTLFGIDDGSDVRAFRLTNTAPGNAIAGGRIASGAEVSNLMDSMVPGVPFRVGMTVGGAGNAIFSFNGVTSTTLTGGPTSALTTFRVGNNGSNTRPMFGQVIILEWMPFSMTLAELNAAVSALPVL
jgi:hypothetical protein